MKHRLISLSIIVLILMSTVGCSAVRLMQTRAGVAVTKKCREVGRTTDAFDPTRFPI